MRTDDERCVPIVSLRLDVFALDRIDVEPLAGQLVETHDATVLTLGVNDVRICRIDDRVKSITAVRCVPIGIHYPGLISRPCRTAQRVVVLRTPVDVVEGNIVIYVDVVELRDRQIRLELPASTAVKALVHAAVATDQ